MVLLPNGIDVVLGDGRQEAGVGMKANKALKRLTKIEASLSNLIERYAPTEQGVKGLLHDAKTTILRAKKAVSLQASSRTVTSASVKAGKPKRPHLTAESRRRISVGGKKRRKGQATKKASQKITRKKPATPVVKGTTRAKSAKPAVAKKVAMKHPVRKVAKKAAVKAPVKKVVKKVAAKVVNETAAPTTKNGVEVPKHAVPVPESPAQGRGTGESSVGLPSAPGSSERNE
jgi:hypothetical protein